MVAGWCEAAEPVGQLLERPCLELMYPLAGEPKLPPDLFERLRLAFEAEAELDDPPLARAAR